MPEICRKSPFLQIFIGLSPYISLFFHTKTIFITIPAINHSLIVKKNDFCSRNFLKMSEQPIFAVKTVFLEFLEPYSIFFHEIWHTDFHWTFSLYFVFFSHKNIYDIAFSFLRSFVRLFVRSYFHYYQVGPISMWLVSSQIEFENSI